MEENLDNQDKQTPPLPSGYTPIKKQDSQAPPLPSGYTLKKKGSSEPTSQRNAVESPTRPTQQSTSSDTEPPTRAQASVASGGPTKLFGQEEQQRSKSVMYGDGIEQKDVLVPSQPIDISQSIKYLEKTKSNPKELKRLKDEKAKMPEQKTTEYYLNKQIVNNLTPSIDKANTITDEDKADRDSSFEADWSNTGFVNKVKKLGSDILGTAAKAFNPSTIKSDFTSTPLEKYKNEVIKDATDNKEKLTPEQLKAKVQDRYNNDWDTDKRAYNLTQLNYTLNDEEQKAIGEDVFNKDKNLNESQRYYLNTASTLSKVKDNIGVSLVSLDKQLSEKIKNGEAPTEAEIQSYNSLKEKYNQYSLDAQNAYGKYSKNLDKVHSLETELDVFDNENLHSLEFLKRLGIGVEQLGVGAIDFTAYLANLYANSTPYSVVTKGGNSEAAIYLHKKANDLRDTIEEQNKGIRDSSNRFEGVLSKSVDFITENTPMVLGLTYGGATAMYGLAATTAGEKYGETVNENKDYNQFQMTVAPLLHGSAMLLPLSKQLKTIQNSGRVLIAGEKEFPKIVENVYKEKAANLFGKIKTFAGESFDLGNQLKLMTILQEVNNSVVLGKDINFEALSDIEVYATAPLLHGMNKVAPYIAGKVTEPFMSKEDYKVIDEGTVQIFDLNKKLQSGELDANEAEIIKQTIKDISAKSEKVVTNKLDKIGEYSKETVDNILDANKQASDLREKANRVISSENIDPKQKKIIVENLRGEYNSIEQTKEALISGNTKNIIYVKKETDIPIEAERVKGSQYKVVENSVEKKLFEKQQMSVNATAENKVEEKNGVFYATNKEGITKGFNTKEAAELHLGNEVKPTEAKPVDVEQKNIDEFYKIHEESYNITDKAGEDLRSDKITADEYTSIHQNEQSKTAKKLKELKDRIGDDEYNIVIKNADINWYENHIEGTERTIKEIENKKNPTEEDLNYKKREEEYLERNKQELTKAKEELKSLKEKRNKQPKPTEIKAEEVKPAEDIEAKKADIEKRREEELKSIIQTQPIEALNEKGNVIFTSDKTVEINAKYDAELKALEEVKPTETKTVTHKEIEYTKNENGNWVNTKTGNEIKGIGDKGKDLIKTLDDLAKPVESNGLAKEYIESIEKVKAEDPEKFWSVDRPFQNEDGTINEVELNKAAEEGRLIKTGAGFGVVGENGDIKGVFKSDVKSTEKTGDKVIQEAVKAGGIKLDNFALPNLMKIYERNGFREVSRLPFNKEYAPEGWTEAQGTPDVVAMVYDPQGKLNIEKKSFTDYDEAMKYRDSYVEEAKSPKEVKPAEVKPTIKTKLEAFKAKHIDRPVFDRTKLNTQVENAKKSILKILPNVKFVIHDTRESFIKEAGKNAPGFYDPATKTIHINALDANSRTVYHEVFHPLLIERLKTDSNVRELTKKMLGALSRTMDANPDLKKTLDDFVTRYEENLKSEEKVTELFANLADGYEGFDAPTKSLIKKFIDRIATMFGLKPFTEGDVVGMLKTLAGKVSTGEEIVNKDVKIIKEQKIIKDAVSKFQFDFIDPKSKVEFIYDKNKDKFKKLESEGYITKEKSIEDFDGQTIFLHQPDAAFSGEIYKNGERLVEGKGGVYYPIKFHEDGYFWASTSSTANKMAKDLNVAREANGGRLLMALTSAPSDKLLSSTTAANGVMDIVLSKAFDKNFSLNKEQAKTSLIDAANKVVVIEGKKIGLGLKLKKRSTLEEVKSEIQNKLNPDNSSFADRKAFVKSLISNVADIVKQNPKAVDQFGKFFSEGIKNESFKGVTKTGKLSISAANMTQGISEMLTEPMLKEGVDRNKGGQVYAILELNGEVKPIDSNKHESYPKAIQSVDPNNKVKLHILKDRVKWSDVFEDPTTGDIVSKERELKIFPTSGVSTEGLKLNTKKGKFQEPESYSDMKDIVKDMMDEGKSIEEIKNVIGTELGKDQILLAERAYNEFKTKPILSEEPKTTSIKNAVVAAEREAKGKEPVEQREKYSSKVNYEETKAKVDSGEILPRDLASAIVNNPKGVAITSEVSDALAYDRMKLSNEYDQVLKNIVENPNDPTNIIARDRLEKQMEENDQASRYSGTISSHALLSRKNVIKQDYSLDRMILRYKAATGGEISDQMRAKFEAMSTKLQEANAKLEEYQTKESERLALKALVEIKKEVRQQKRTESKEGLKKEREDLYAKLRDIRKEQMSRLSANPIPVEMIPVISKLAKNLIMDGVITLDGVVDEIHTNLKDIFDDIQKRDIRDALSGYGNLKLPSKDEIDIQLREIKSQGRLVSAYEDASSGKAPLKTGFQRETPSDRVRELQRQVQEMMKQNGITKESVSGEANWKTALDGIKTRLKNQIRDLEKQIATGEKTPKKTGVTYDAEANILKEQRDALKKIVEDTEGKREISDEQRVKTAVSAVEKSIAEYERRISERDISPKEKGVKTPETPELKILKDIRDNIKTEYEQMKEEIDPKRTPEERALASIKTRLNNRTAELQGMLDSGNFEKKKRTPTPLDKEAMELRANVERIKNKVDIEIKKEEQKNRTKYEKTLDFISGWRRTMLLTGVKVLGKLQTAAMTRSTVTPIEEIIGGVLSKIPGISKISEKAPRQGGGFVAKAELKAISQWWQKATYKDMYEIAKSGKGMLDLLHGKKDDLPPSVLDIFGQLHQALKQPAKRNEYFRSFEKRLAHANRNGIDVTDPMVQLAIGTESYLDANRAIFMQENLLTGFYKQGLNYLERNGDVGKTGAAFAKIILPIVKVPTNYVGEVTSYAGGYAKALPLISKAILKGVNSLSPEQADYVMKNLKKGSLGAAFITLGYFNAQAIGGYYQRGEKRKEEDVEAAGLRLFGEDMPKWLVHTPLLECLQIGSTLRRVQDSYDKKGKEEESISASGLAVAKGLIEEVPFARSTEEALRVFGSTKQFKKYTRDLLESMINPQLTRELFDLEILPKIESKEGKVSMEELKTKSPGMYNLIMKLKKGAK